MPRLLPLIAAFLCLLLIGCAHAGTPPGSSPPEKATRVVVKFRPETPEVRIADIARRFNLEPVPSTLPAYHIFQAPPGIDLDSLVRCLKALPEVELAQPDQKFRIAQ
jgi:hypothetical protein